MQLKLKFHSLFVTFLWDVNIQTLPLFKEWNNLFLIWKSQAVWYNEQEEEDQYMTMAYREYHQKQVCRTYANSDFKHLSVLRNLKYFGSILGRKRELGKFYMFQEIIIYKKRTSFIKMRCKQDKFLYKYI